MIRCIKVFVILAICTNFGNARNCKDARRIAMSSTNRRGIPGLIGTFIPMCTKDGSWNLVQCSAHSGFCWCVRKSNGESLLGSNLRFERPLNCTTSCIRKRHSAIFLNARFKLTPFVPKCDKDGAYSSKQCDLTKRKCFCVKDRDSGKPDMTTYTDFSRNGIFSSLQC